MRKADIQKKLERLGYKVYFTEGYAAAKKGVTTYFRKSMHKLFRDLTKPEW